MRKRDGYILLFGGQISKTRMGLNNLRGSRERVSRSILGRGETRLETGSRSN